MPHSTHGTIVLMGSGEMAPSLVETHKYAMSLAEGQLKAVFLDTPAGFQLNADYLSEKAVEFFGDKLNTTLKIASFKSAEKASAEEIAEAVNTLYEASYIFAGPGSPTYALKQWKSSPLADILFERLVHGGCLTFASAAALTLGRFTIPVYEIYKVGESLSWVDGLNLLGHNGLDIAFVPHWNNTSGGDHDTRFCFMGEPRWLELRRQLPSTTVILGMDEHTACIIRLDPGVCEVRGVGQVTLIRGQKEQVFRAGEAFDVDLLKPVRSDELEKPTEMSDEAITTQWSSPTWDKIRASHDALIEAVNPTQGEVATYIYDLMTLMTAARERADWETMKQAEQAVREALVEIIARMGNSTGNIDELIGPYIDLLLELRLTFRSNKQWDQADLIRKRLGTLGIVVEDGPQGSTWHAEN
jgi:peptidase E